MQIREICDLLKNELLNNGYEYGFYLNGVKYKPDVTKGYDEEFARASVHDYRIQDPSDTMREKIGTCIDITLLMKTMLASYGISSKIWLLYYMRRNKFHTILTFEAENKVVYLELTPQSRKSWYGKEILYENERYFISEYCKDDCVIEDITNSVVIGKRPEFILSRSE